MRMLGAIPAALLAAPLFAGDVLPTWGARLEVPGAATSLGPAAFADNWGGLRATGGIKPLADGSRAFSLQLWEGGRHVEKARGSLSFREEGDAVRVAYSFEVTADVELKQLCVNAFFPMAEFAGGEIGVDAGKASVPKTCRGGPFLRRTVSGFTLTDAKGTRRLALSFARPTEVFVQDDRFWGGRDTMCLRIVLEGTRAYRAGETFSTEFTLSDGGRTRLSQDVKGYKIEAGPEWIPLVEEPDIVPGSALDFSSLRGTDAPAGRHGRIIAKDGHFAFEDSPGVSRRFYGVNICGYANVPEAASARPFARRLALTGYNAIRFHHHECALVEKDGLTLIPARMERFDALVAACVEHGIYLTTDLFVSRRPISFRSIGIDRDGLVGSHEFRELVLAHDGAYANFIRFARDFLGHVNPHTGRSLAQEPALGWLSLVNEGNLGNNGMQFMARNPCFAEKWRTWLAGKKAADPAAWRDVPDTLPTSLGDRSSRHVIAYTLFMQHLEADFAARVRRFLRDEMGCKALTTDMNGWHYPAAYQLPRARSHDYADFHFYVDHPEFLETSWHLPSTCANANPFANPRMGAPERAFGRVFGRPLAVSEFNYSAPGRFRGVGGIAAGALGGLQDWDAMWRFAWSHNEWGIQKPGTQPLTYFDMCADPLGLAAERAVICLFLRRDAKPLARTCALVAPISALTSPDASPMLSLNYAWAAWYARVGTAIGEPPPDTDLKLSYPSALSASSLDVERRLFNATGRPGIAGDGQIEIDGKAGRFVVRTPGTCGGFAESGVVKAGALEADPGGTAATVWASALDGKAIGASARLLVTHLTDVQNSGMKYVDRSRRILTEWGGMPHLMRRGTAHVKLAVSGGHWRCYALSMGGRRVREVPCAAEDGHVAFVADVSGDPTGATWLYELVRDSPHDAKTPTCGID